MEGTRSNAQPHRGQELTGMLMLTLSINRSRRTVSNSYLQKGKAGPRTSVYELL